jgi:hypothetical protein
MFHAQYEGRVGTVLIFIGDLQNAREIDSHRMRVHCQLAGADPLGLV